MNISRKNFLKSVALVMGGVCFAGNRTLANLLDDSNLKMITKNFWVYTEKGGTIGFYNSPEGAVIIDSQFPETAKNFYSLVQKKINLNIHYLLNTHHHPDHTSGNSFLSQYADKIVAHENVPKFQEELAKQSDNLQQQVYANTLFSSIWNGKVGNESITGTYYGIAHTHGDAVYFFENENIAHMGDLVFNNIYPYIDMRPGGSTIVKWITVLETIAKSFNNSTKFIFGHADTPENVLANVDDIYKMRDYLSALLELVQSETSLGRDKEHILKISEIPGFTHIKATRPGALKGNLEAAFYEINKR
jgi:cyclase